MIDMDTSNIVPPIDEMRQSQLNLQRHYRNQLLDTTDKYVLPDYPLSDEEKNEIKIYRQELRDYFERDDVVNWVFTFQNQQPPDLPVHPRFIKIVICIMK